MKESGLKQIGIYYRVSTDKQDLESQKVAVERWLAELPADRRPKGIRVFEDEGVSGNTTNRPGFKKLLDASYKGKIDTIVVYRLDRFSRQATTAIRLILTLDEAGVGFISVTQPVLNLGHENPFRRTMLAAFAEVAQLEREATVARVMAGLEAARKRGVVFGAPKKLSEEKKQVAMDLRTQGLSMRAIAKKMKLSLGSIHKLLSPANDCPEGFP
jgi:DNA invertase Pin-like site-specific DNA recombinase